MAALGTAALGNLVAALAQDYPLLLVGRVVSVLGAAVYTPGATLVATVLSPPEQRGHAVALVFGGLTFSLLLGVPLGNLLGASLGYRGVFALIALASTLAALALWRWLPRVDAPPPVSLRDRFAPAADRRVLLALALTVLACLAAFSVFNSIAPLLTETAGVTGGRGERAARRLRPGRSARQLGGGPAHRPVRHPEAAAGAVRHLRGRAGHAAADHDHPGDGGGRAVRLGRADLVGQPADPGHADRPGPANGGLLLSINASAIYLGVGLSGAVGGLVLLLFALRPVQEPKALVVT
ncbi:MFS transporter [Saccharothrix xinjiangensis]|uniref:MFS transporter n=1 Tax=Saccharothrix xinjiangensis TaxID=204798 RepID=UPI003CD08CB8